MASNTAKSINILESQFALNVYCDPFNKRIRVDDYRGNVLKVLKRTEMLAKEWKAEKTIIKGRQEDFYIFIEKGYLLEGSIDRYFLGSQCYLFTKYYSAERRSNIYHIEEDQTIHDIYNLTKTPNIEKPPKQYKLRKASEHDAKKLALLYERVFEIYPTPLNNHEYIKKTMKEGTIYYVYEIDGEIVSASSADINTFYKNAEITDCATLPHHRKFGLLKSLIVSLEEELASIGIFCVYSIARALSFGMNAALFQLGYHYRGRLTNNCYIFNKLEDMNVWVKNNANMPNVRQ